MKKNILIIFPLLISSIALQSFFKIKVEASFIHALLTAFSIFFGFYLVSFTGFFGSRYLNQLYKEESIADNSKTLLDELLAKFRTGVLTLLASILILIIMSVISLPFLSYPLWGIIVFNLYYVYSCIEDFIKITRQSIADIS